MSRTAAVTAFMALMCSAFHQASASMVAFTPTANASTTISHFTYTFGYRFEVTSAVVITHLGMFDVGSDGLPYDATVRLWTDAGTLLGQGLVSTADPFVGPAITFGATNFGRFRYDTLVTPILLTPGFYRIAGKASNQNFLGLDYIVNAASSGVSGPFVKKEAAYTTGTPSSFPTTLVAGTPNGYFGPNFQYDFPAATVTEPTSIALCGIGALGMIFGARRRRRQTTAA